MRPTQSLKLPICGLTAHFVTYWSWSEKQEIQRVALGDTSVDPDTQAVSEIKATNGLDLNKKALQLAIRQLVDDKGVETPTEEFLDLPESDVELVLNVLKTYDVALKKN